MRGVVCFLIFLVFPSAMVGMLYRAVSVSALEAGLLAAFIAGNYWALDWCDKGVSTGRWFAGATLAAVTAAAAAIVLSYWLVSFAAVSLAVLGGCLAASWTLQQRRLRWDSQP